MTDKNKGLLKYILLYVAGASLGILAQLYACGCSSAPATNDEKEKSDRVYFTVRNDTGQHLYGQISGGLMGRSIDLEPNTEKSFWGYRSMVPDKIIVTITDKAPAPRRK